jgi:hypothetical protein
MHEIYFDQIHPLYSSVSPFTPFENNFNRFAYSIFVHMFKCFDHIHWPLTFLLPPRATGHHPQTVPILYSCIHFLRIKFHTWKRIWDISPSQSSLFWLTWWSLFALIFLQMTYVHYSLWLHNAPLCTCSIFSLPTHQLMGI